MGIAYGQATRLPVVNLVFKSINPALLLIGRECSRVVSCFHHPPSGIKKELKSFRTRHGFQDITLINIFY
jgi:hypothetical protein